MILLAVLQIQSFSNTIYRQKFYHYTVKYHFLCSIHIKGLKTGSLLYFSHLVEIHILINIYKKKSVFIRYIKSKFILQFMSICKPYFHCGPFDSAHIEDGHESDAGLTECFIEPQSQGPL